VHARCSWKDDHATATLRTRSVTPILAIEITIASFSGAFEEDDDDAATLPPTPEINCPPAWAIN